MNRIGRILVFCFLLVSLLASQAGTAHMRAPRAASLPLAANAPAVLKLDDINLRRAVAYCTDKAALARSVYPYLSDDQVNELVMDSFIPEGHWAYDPSSYQYPYDPDEGRTLLENAGWTVDDSGFRRNAQGIRLALTFTTTNASFRQTWGNAFAQQMAECGIQVVPFYTPSSWWFGDTTGLIRRDFELGAFAWVGQMDPGGRTLYACDQIPSPENGWTGQNYIGWCNPTASDAIIAATNTIVQTDRAAAYSIVQEEFGKDVPSLPLFNRSEYYAHTSALTGFAPLPGEQYYSYNAQQWNVPGDTLFWGMSQEPASLFRLTQNTWVTHLVLAAVEGRAYTTGNYNPQPMLQDPLATIENGSAVNATVSVSAGSLVVSANGSVVTLAVGVEVINADGERVTFTGTPINMKQLSVQYRFMDTLKWNDGTLVAQEDFELGYEITCAFGNYRCQYVEIYTANAHGYDITWYPGIQDPLYYLAPFGFYPAHRPITHPDYDTLGELPASEWIDQLEVTDLPWGAGPYYVSEWVRGDHITLTRNEHYALGLAATPTIRVEFTNNPVGEVIAGSIDLIGADALVGITEDLNNAANVTTLGVASATWEHIDFNFDLVQPATYPLESLSVRRAVAYCTDKTALVKSAYPWLTTAQAASLVRDSFLPAAHWAFKTPSTTYPYNPVQGKALLTSAGWVQSSDGYRYNAAGEQLSIKLTSTWAAFRQEFLSVFEQQMQACGIRVLRLHADPLWFYGNRPWFATDWPLSGLGLREFEMGEYAWANYDWDASTLQVYLCSAVPSAENLWQGQNASGWCNQAADAALRQGFVLAPTGVRAPYLWTAVDEFAKDLPVLPLFDRPSLFAYKTALLNFAPHPGEERYSYNIYQWQTGSPAIKWAVTEEPNTLSPLFGGTTVESIIYTAIYGLPASYNNYSAQAILQKDLPTLENGLAHNNTITVAAGDIVLDAGGNPVSLEPGVTVFDPANNLVTFTGTALQMKQLVVQYDFLDNLKWEDGSLVNQADFQLGYDAACDPATGAGSFSTVCDKIKAFTASTHGYTITYIPGYQAPGYSIAPIPYFPAHRPISGYGALADVPFNQWSSLYEVNRDPWSAGPYTVSSWNAGAQISLAKNPYFALGAPATNTININLVSPDELDTAMINNDLVGFESLFAFSDAILANGALVKLALPSRFYEHIDFNLGVPRLYAQPVPVADSITVDLSTTIGEVSLVVEGVTSPGLIEVTLDSVTAEETPAFKTILWPAFSITADEGLEFTSLTITLPYNESDVLQAGLVEANLKLYHFEGDQWVDVTTAVDTVNNTITGVVDSLSPFLIGGNTIRKIYLPVTLK